MGAAVTSEHSESNKPGISGTGRSTESTSPTTSETGRTGGNGTSGRTGGEKGNEAETVILEVANVKDEKLPERKPGETDEAYQKRVEKNAKKREAYAASKSQNGGSYKPRKVNQGSAKKATVVDTLQIETLIRTVSTITSSRPGFEIWKLSDAEIKSISTPLGNIISKSEALSAMGEHTDAIALLVAAVTIFAPRIIIMVTLKKEEKKSARTGQRVDTNTKPADNKTGTPEPVTRIADRKAAPNSAPVTPNLSWLGSPTA